MVCHGGKGRGSSHWYDWVDGLFSGKHHLHHMRRFQILVSKQRKLNVGHSWLLTMVNLHPFRYEQLDAAGRGVESYAVKEVDLQILQDSQTLSACKDGK